MGPFGAGAETARLADAGGIDVDGARGAGWGGDGDAVTGDDTLGGDEAAPGDAPARDGPRVATNVTSAAVDKSATRAIAASPPVTRGAGVGTGEGLSEAMVGAITSTDSPFGGGMDRLVSARASRLPSA